jgi:hypothetical protein
MFLSIIFTYYLIYHSFNLPNNATTSTLPIQNAHALDTSWLVIRHNIPRTPRLKRQSDTLTTKLQIQIAIHLTPYSRPSTWYGAPLIRDCFSLSRSNRLEEAIATRPPPRNQPRLSSSIPISPTIQRHDPLHAILSPSTPTSRSTRYRPRSGPYPLQSYRGSPTPAM